MRAYPAGSDVTVLNDHLEVPGLGFLPVNAFVIAAREPVVVDTGVSLPDRDFVATLSTVIDPTTIRWIWLTHPDRDHTGGLARLLEIAPRAQVVTTFIGVGIMSTYQPLPLDRVYLLNPGQQLDVGDRTLHAFRPALFDNPATVGFYDDRTRACFSSDCFGAPLATSALAECPDVREVPADDLRAGQLLWAAIDSPWVHGVDTARFAEAIAAMPSTDADVVFSTHLPPAIGMGSQLSATLREAPQSTPFVGPDQEALLQMMAAFHPAPAPA